MQSSKVSELSSNRIREAEEEEARKEQK